MNDNLEYVCALSPTQDEMLFHTLGAPGSAVWTVQYVVTLDGDVDADALERAWQATVQRHPTLRTAFFWERLEKPLQVAYRSVPFHLYTCDETCAHPVQDIARADREAGFDLSDAPLLRVSLIRCAERRHALILTFHHIILDGWSLGLALRDAMAAYQAIRDGRELRLPPSPPYRDYIAWLHSHDLSDAETYWRRVLRGLSRPDGNARPCGAGYCRQERRLSADVTGRLTTVAKVHRVALNTIVVATWADVLARHCGHDEVTLGITMSHRPATLPLVKERVGVFINTLPLRLPARSDRPLSAWLATVAARIGELQEYSHTPLDRVRAWCGLPRYAAIFDSHLVFENYPFNPRNLRFAPGVALTGAQSFEHTHYPLTVIVDPGSELHILMQYQQSRFASGAIRHLLACYAAALESIAALAPPLAEAGYRATAPAATHHEEVSRCATNTPTGPS